MGEQEVFLVRGSPPKMPGINTASHPLSLLMEVCGF